MSSVSTPAVGGSVGTSVGAEVPVSASEKIEKRKPDPLIYIIIFAILFLITLGLLTWVLDVYHKQLQCAADPNIWCSDRWECTQTCTRNSAGACQQSVNPNSTVVSPSQLTPVNDCYCQFGPGTTGLASCLYGPNAVGATNCLNPGFDSTDVGDCNCPTGTVNTRLNCFQNCPQSLEETQSNNAQTCCCNPNNYPINSTMWTYCTEQQASLLCQLSTT